MEVFNSLPDIASFASPPNPDKLETALYPTFASILQNDVQGTLISPDSSLIN